MDIQKGALGSIGEVSFIALAASARSASTVLVLPNLCPLGHEQVLVPGPVLVQIEVPQPPFFLAQALIASQLETPSPSKPVREQLQERVPGPVAVHCALTAQLPLLGPSQRSISSHDSIFETRTLLALDGSTRTTACCPSHSSLEGMGELVVA